MTSWFWLCTLCASVQMCSHSWFEPRHDKTNKMSVRLEKTQISLGIRPIWSESLLSAWRKLGSLATHWAHSEDWSDWADAQADLSLCWSHTHFVDFEISWLTSLLYGPGAVARSEACPLGMQAATSSILTSGTVFRGDLVIFPLPLIQEEQLLVTGERMCTQYW